jgi:hypothetical protein
MSLFNDGPFSSGSILNNYSDARPKHHDADRPASGGPFSPEDMPRLRLSRWIGVALFAAIAIGYVVYAIMFNLGHRL